METSPLSHRESSGDPPTVCLLAAETHEKCEQGTQRILAELGELGYRVSAKKAQMCRTEVTFLRYILRDGQRWLTDARKQTVYRSRPHHPLPGKRISGDSWVLQTVDTRVCYVCCPTISPYQRKRRNSSGLKTIRRLLINIFH